MCIYIQGGVCINYYDNIKNLLIDNEVYSKVKDYSKERNRVITYYEIGRILYEAGNKYGESIIKNYSIRLISEVGKKYNERTLRSMRQLYLMFNDEFWKPLVSKMTWTNLLLIMPLKDKHKMKYYIDISIKLNLSKRQLRERIKSKEYERLDDNTKNKLINKEETTISDFIKNPVIINNPNDIELVNEKVLLRFILEDIEHFMNELGIGFCFIGSEYKIKLGDRYNYIDLLLYNYLYNSFVVIELKICELKKEHIGQIHSYMNYIDKNIKQIGQSNTIGIIISRKNNRFVIEYSSDSRIFFKEFILK